MGTGLVWMCWLAGCATAHGLEPPAVSVPGGMVRVVLGPGAPGEDQTLVAYAAEEGLASARRWGELRFPVVLRVHGNHAALEHASHQADVPWMRGWARFDEVELEAPSAWGGDRNPANVVELLRHELTHVVMYQNVASAQNWADLDIPLWFREGMASVTSQQGYRRMSARDLASWLKVHPREDPWLRSENFPAQHQPVIYGAAHRAFERLLDRAGDEGVKRILAALRYGRSFEDAFAESVGYRPGIFLAGFRDELERSLAAQPVAAASVPAM